MELNYTSQVFTKIKPLNGVIWVHRPELHPIKCISMCVVWFCGLKPHKSCFKSFFQGVNRVHKPDLHNICTSLLWV